MLFFQPEKEKELTIKRSKKVRRDVQSDNFTQEHERTKYNVTFVGRSSQQYAERARSRKEGCTRLQGGIHIPVNIHRILPYISVEGTAIPRLEFNTVKLGIILGHHKTKWLFNGEAARKNRAAAFSLGGGCRFWRISSNFMRPRCAHGEPSQCMRVLGWEISRSERPSLWGRHSLR